MDQEIATRFDRLEGWATETSARVAAIDRLVEVVTANWLATMAPETAERFTKDLTTFQKLPEPPPGVDKKDMEARYQLMIDRLKNLLDRANALAGDIRGRLQGQ